MKRFALLALLALAGCAHNCEQPEQHGYNARCSTDTECFELYGY